MDCIEYADHAPDAGTGCPSYASSEIEDEDPDDGEDDCDLTLSRSRTFDNVSGLRCLTAHGVPAVVTLESDIVSSSTPVAFSHTEGTLTIRSPEGSRFVVPPLIVEYPATLVLERVSIPYPTIFAPPLAPSNSTPTESLSGDDDASLGAGELFCHLCASEGTLIATDVEVSGRYPDSRKEVGVWAYNSAVTLTDSALSGLAGYGVEAWAWAGGDTSVTLDGVTVEDSQRTPFLLWSDGTGSSALDVSASNLTLTNIQSDTSHSALAAYYPRDFSLSGLTLTDASNDELSLCKGGIGCAVVALLYPERDALLEGIDVARFEGSMVFHVEGGAQTTTLRDVTLDAPDVFSSVAYLRHPSDGALSLSDWVFSASSDASVPLPLLLTITTSGAVGSSRAEIQGLTVLGNGQAPFSELLSLYVPTTLSGARFCGFGEGSSVPTTLIHSYEGALDVDHLTFQSVRTPMYRALLLAEDTPLTVRNATLVDVAGPLLSADTRDATVYNSAFSGVENPFSAWPTTFSGRNNLFFESGALPDALPSGEWGTEDLYEAPGFVDSFSATDCSTLPVPAEGSPLIDAGWEGAPLDDDGTRSDIGAWLYDQRPPEDTASDTASGTAGLTRTDVVFWLGGAPCGCAATPPAAALLPTSLISLLLLRRRRPA